MNSNTHKYTVEDAEEKPNANVSIDPSKLPSSHKQEKGKQFLCFVFIVPSSWTAWSTCVRKCVCYSEC